MNQESKAIIELLAMLVLDPRRAMLIALLLAAAWSDFRTGRIPNRLVFGGALAGLVLGTLVPEFQASPATAFLLALAGLGCGLAALLPLYWLRAMGAGDVKLMAMTGAFLGYPDAIWAVLATFISGGLLSLAWLLRKGALRRGIGNIVAILHGFVLGIAIREKPSLAVEAGRSSGTLPYGLAIATGTIGYLVVRQLGLLPG